MEAMITFSSTVPFPRSLSVSTRHHSKCLFLQVATASAIALLAADKTAVALGPTSTSSLNMKFSSSDSINDHHVTSMSMASDSSVGSRTDSYSVPDSSSDSGRRTIRALALHGSGETAQEFPSRFAALSQELAQKHDTDLKVTLVQGAFEKGQGYSWWTMPPGVRSYAADRYDGFETSASRVLDAWQNEGEHADGDGARDWQFDLVLGHSQGAAMVAALIALHRNPYHPRLGYIFNGVSFPNPYRTQITQENLNVVTEGDPPPRGLFVVGKTDEIVPNETAEELRDEMQKAGMDVQTIYHNGGHSIPSDVDAVESICQWLVSPFKTK